MRLPLTGWLNLKDFEVTNMPPTMVARFNEYKPLVVFISSLVVSAISLVWYLSAQKSAIDTRMAIMESRLVELAAALENDRYTLTQAAERALRSAIENPGLRVPDPRDPSSIITVNSHTTSKENP